MKQYGNPTTIIKLTSVPKTIVPDDLYRFDHSQMMRNNMLESIPPSLNFIIMEWIVVYERNIRRDFINSIYMRFSSVENASNFIADNKVPMLTGIKLKLQFVSPLPNLLFVGGIE